MTEYVTVSMQIILNIKCSSIKSALTDAKRAECLILMNLHHMPSVPSLLSMGGMYCTPYCRWVSSLLPRPCNCQQRVSLHVMKLHPTDSPLSRGCGEQLPAAPVTALTAHAMWGVWTRHVEGAVIIRPWRWRRGWKTLVCPPPVKAPALHVKSQ